MKISKSLSAVLVAALAGVALVGVPAQADGDTVRVNGCAAHWRRTAAWNECQNSPGATLRLRLECDWDFDYIGAWRYASGWVDPLDKHECGFRALLAYNQFA